MEDAQRTELAKRFTTLYLQKHIITFDIPDLYTYRQPELIALLEEKMHLLVEPLLK